MKYRDSEYTTFQMQISVVASGFSHEMSNIAIDQMQIRVKDKKIQENAI